ncbi:MAG: C4-dicarboxylate ABC transporter permease [Nitratiruptor sp.]|nr:C4-dicarboxylate ABC transporter permease [Nitratiruptor sp.]NPA83224.1 TRAP transporter large permease subunit [Campylobacterota bacterium]
MQVAERIERFNAGLAQIGAFALIALALLVFYDALVRYLFHAGSIALQELEWHLFDLTFLLGAGYTLARDGHVRVDLLFERFSPQIQALIRWLDAALLVLPFALLVGYYGGGFVAQSFLQHEASSDPGGLCCRYLIKGAILLFALSLALGAIAQILKEWGRLSSSLRLLALLILGGSGVGAWWLWVSEALFWFHPALLMALSALLLLAMGFRVAFVFGMVGFLFALADWDLSLDLFAMLPMRIYGIMQNFTLMAVPLFIFMGLILERSQVAKELLEHFGALFGPIRGGLAIGVVLVGAILAAATGIVGASVVMMTLITLPVMLAHGYDKALASGTIAASGTLGQIIPPSIVLIILGDVLGVSVGDLFKGALVPGLLLVLAYILYILLYATVRPEVAPPVRLEHPIQPGRLLQALLPTLALVGAVLGSIFIGLATPTESAAMGVVGAGLLAWWRGDFDWRLLGQVALESVELTAMIFTILIGATAFSLVFNEIGGEELVRSFFSYEIGSRELFLWIAMALVLFLGFFIDFVEISFVVIPLFVPLLAEFGIDPIWFAILMALNLQTSFLTPPFGFSLFYLKGSAKGLVSTKDIYKGVLPFILLQLLVLLLVYFYPELVKVW